MVSSKLDKLYAKSQSSKDGSDPARSLLQHTMDVVNCAESLFKVSGDSMLEAFRLDPDKWRARLRRDWWLAAWLHDLGKANNQFQSMLRRERRNPQAIRHEALSYWIVTQEEIRSWLGQLVPDSQELTLIFWAVAGHHRKFTAEVDTQQGTGVKVAIFLDHTDFASVLQAMAI